jgi:hypothetical protein
VFCILMLGYKGKHVVIAAQLMPVRRYATEYPVKIQDVFIL